MTFTRSRGRRAERPRLMCGHSSSRSAGASFPLLKTETCRRSTSLEDPPRLPDVPRAEDPDLGAFVQGIERALADRGHEIERVVTEGRGGGKRRHLRLARDVRRAGKAGRRLRALPRPDRPLGGALRTRTARRHGPRTRRPQHRRVSRNQGGDPLRGAPRLVADRSLRLPSPRARGEDPRSPRQDGSRRLRRRPRALHRARPCYRVLEMGRFSSASGA